MDDFPEEIALNVLSRLPVKSLVRFRCVSKPWRVLIDSFHFIKLHLKRSSGLNRNLIIASQNSLYSVDLCSPYVVVQLDHHPLNCKGRPGTTDVVGSCDGLVLLYASYGGNVILWNPFTREYQQVAFTDFECDFPLSDSGTHYGLGYDAVSDDYKVLRVIQDHPFPGDTFDSEVKVYSLKSNQCRRVRDLPHYLMDDSNYHGVFAGGALHWVAYRKHEQVVSAFDLATEEHRLVPLPDPRGWRRLTVGVLEGCLYIYCYRDEDCQGKADVWVMKDYGVSESWTKLFSVAPGCMCPLGFSTNGDELVMVHESKKLILFDLQYCLVTIIEVRGLPRRFSSQVCCVQSLVPPHNKDREGEGGN